MPFKLIIELSDRDLRHFRRELRHAREAVGIADDEEIDIAGKLVARAIQRCFGRFDHFFVRGVGPAKGDVLPDGGGEKGGLLLVVWLLYFCIYKLKN